MATIGNEAITLNQLSMLPLGGGNSFDSYVSLVVFCNGNSASGSIKYVSSNDYTITGNGTITINTSGLYQLLIASYTLDNDTVIKIFINTISYPNIIYNSRAVVDGNAALVNRIIAFPAKTKLLVNLDENTSAAKGSISITLIKIS